MCTNCKKRKIKCDRKMPCLTCVKSNSGYSCTYELKWRPISFAGANGEHIIDKGLADGSIMQTSLADFRTSPSSLKSETPVPIPHHDFVPNYANPHIPPLKENKDTALDELAHLRSKLNQLESSLKKREATDLHSPSSSDHNSDFSKSSVNLKKDLGKMTENDVINFYDGCAPILGKGTFRRKSYGPLAWVSLMKKDPWLSLVWKSFDTKGPNLIPLPRGPQINPENNQVFSTPPENNPGVGSSDVMFRRRTLELEGYGEIVPFRTLTNHQNRNMQANFNFTNMTLAKTLFEGKINPEIELIDRVKQMLPKKKVLWTLIDTFFRTLYPFFPFLDEAEFKKDLSSILGPISYADENLDKVNIEKKLDLAYIAICLFILRMTYVSLFSNRDCVNVQWLESKDNTEHKYLLSNPINIAVIDVARACIMSFQATRKFNFVVFQAVLFMRLYSNHAPEEGDGIDGGDSQTAQGSLVQMAYSLGLHREPDTFDDTSMDERAKHMGRKIWHFLYRTDVVNCYSIGNLPIINEKFFDTKLPYVTPKNSNISDLKMEELVVTLYSYNQNELTRFDLVLKLILDIRQGCPVSELMELVEKVESFCNNNINIFKLHPDLKVLPMHYSPEEMLYILKSRVFVSAKSSLITIYFHLYLYYENKIKFEQSFFFLMRIHTIITDDLLPYFFEILYGRLSNHGLLLNPTVLTAMHKCNQFCLSNLTRINYLKFSMESKSDHDSRLLTDFEYNIHYKRILSLSNKIRSAIESLVKLFDKFSSRYYYAWRITKAHRLLLKFLKREDFYKRPTPTVKKLHSFQYTANQLEQITRTIQRLSKYSDSLVNYEDSHDKEPENPVFPKQSLCSRPSEMSVTSINNINANQPAVKTPTSTSDTPDLSHSVNNQYLDQMWLLMMAMKDSDINTPFVNDYYMLDQSLAHRGSVGGFPDFTNQTEPAQPLQTDASYNNDYMENHRRQDSRPVNYHQQVNTQPQGAPNHSGGQPAMPVPDHMSNPNNIHLLDNYNQSHGVPLDGKSVLDNNEESVPFYFNSESDLVGLYNLEQLLN